MNPYWVRKAQHAFETGQPRMAELYMRRGLGETEEGAAWLRAYDFWAGLRAAYRAAENTAAAVARLFFPAATEQQRRVDRMMAQFRLEQQAGYQVMTDRHRPLIVHPEWGQQA